MHLLYDQQQTLNSGQLKAWPYKIIREALLEFTQGSVF